MILNEFAKSALRFAGLVGTSFVAATSALAQTNTGTIQDVQHVVILMEENRSFDHYFGCLGGVRGFNDRNAVLFTNGQSDFYQPSNGSYVLPFPNSVPCITDVDHSHGTGLTDWDSGKWDQWIPAKDPETMCYYTPQSLPFHYALANGYTVCDDYFCSLIGPTFPNRLFLFTGTVDPNGANGGPAVANQVPPGGFTWTTYPERLQKAGVSWRVYRPSGDWFGDVLPWFAQFQKAMPGNPLYDRGVAMVPDVAAALRSDVTNGTLPRVSWVIPTIAASEHPPYSPANGAIFVKSILDALALDSNVLHSTVFLLTYDENDGFFDHIPSPIAPPGTPDEYVNGEPLGLGVRVPMVIVSPWSRGGRVCSQVFDHTSVIRFLETWTGVQETNISAWRRQVCGDLTSAFDFARPDYSDPILPNLTAVSAPAVTPAVPALQSLPVQQTNSRLSMPLPYQPEVTAWADCASGQLFLAMTNAGSASVHFAVYANFAQTNIPWQLDVAPGGGLTNSFAVSTADGASYDFTCYGPNGFQRRFAGNVNSDCNQIEAASSIDTNASGITISMTNSTTEPVTFVLTDGYGLGGPWTNIVSSGLAGTNRFPVVASNNGWYDLTVTASADASFVRHFTGHIETGYPMLSEPVLTPASAITPAPVVNPPAVITAAATTVTNAPAVVNLLALIPPAPATNTLPLFSAADGTNLVLIWPAWASNCVVQANSSLDPASWAPVNVQLNFVSNYVLAEVPCSASNMFYRLRQ